MVRFSKAPADNDMPPDILSSMFRAGRLTLHLICGMCLAAIYPHLHQAGQSRILKTWSRKLLAILDVGILIEGPQPARGGSGCLIVANHVSWLDILVLNAIHPSQFIAKSEVRNWPLIGWLCRRCGTIFIERTLRQDTSRINQHISLLLKQGACIGLFPEGTTTDGKQVGHFHSALIQPAIDAGARLGPIALRYQNEDGHPASAAAFTGDTTLVQSIWQILRAPHMDALMVYTPALPCANENRRVLARTAQAAIAQGLQHAGTIRQTSPVVSQTIPSPEPVYTLLAEPLLHQSPR